MENLHLVLAPLKGFTDMVYRRAWWACFEGLDGAVAPFVSTVAARKIKPAYFRELLPLNNPGIDLVPQVMSKSSDDFIYLARVLGEMGFKRLNWNLGCPSSTVVSRGRGAALMARPAEVDSILRKVMPLIPQTLSIKMRLGFDDPSQGTELLDLLESHAISEVIIHPRLAIQGYTGRVDLEGFQDCLERTSHKVVYNGDIASQDFFCSLSNRFKGISTWMLGRGVLADPFLPSRLKGMPGPPGELAVDRISRFHSLVLEGYGSILHGESHLLARMKAFWHNLAPSFDGGAKTLKRIRKCGSLRDYNEVATKFLESSPTWFPEGRSDTIWWDR